MKRYSSAAVIIFTALCGLSTVMSYSQGANNPFREQNGLVVMEAESVKPGEKWVLQNNNSGWTAGFTGTGYYLFTGNNCKSIFL